MTGPAKALTVHFDRANQDYTRLYDNDHHALSRRRKVDVVEWTQVVRAGTGMIIAGGADATIYSVIVGVIESKADAASCAFTWAPMATADTSKVMPIMHRRLTTIVGPRLSTKPS
ncbi:hypothetical protein NCS55_00805900 [Fusarium keratoplasticum]|nr:hypothetical protein NCS55_00805900 [Fusarium keratoplasticum]